MKKSYIILSLIILLCLTTGCSNQVRSTSSSGNGQVEATHTTKKTYAHPGVNQAVGVALLIVGIKGLTKLAEMTD